MRSSSREKLKRRHGTVLKCPLFRRKMGYLKRGQASSEVKRRLLRANPDISFLSKLISRFETKLPKKGKTVNTS